MRNKKIVAVMTRYTLACGLMLAAGAVCAQADAVKRDWDVTLGAGVAWQPKYPGSDERRVSPAPLVDVRFRSWFLGEVPSFASPFGFGVDLYRDAHWRLGVAASSTVTKVRKESDSARLSGLGDIDRPLRLGGFAVYDAGWLETRGYVGTDVSGSRQGTIATLESELHWQATSRLTLSAGPGLMWANGRYAQTYFGIDAEQSARSGLPAFNARGGIGAAYLLTGARWRIDRHWQLNASAAIERLTGDAADSPIAQRKLQTYFLLGAGYRF